MEAYVVFSATWVTKPTKSVLKPNIQTPNVNHQPKHFSKKDVFHDCSQCIGNIMVAISYKDFALIVYTLSLFNLVYLFDLFVPISADKLALHVV